jgi:hypothetical protein
MTDWFLAASMDVDAAHEDTFNDVYDTEHVPEILGVPGVRSISRFRREDALSISIGGRIEVVRFANEPRYTALYEVESPDVLTSQSWAAGVEAGRWATDVRPFTANRRHLLLRRISHQ